MYIYIERERPSKIKVISSADEAAIILDDDGKFHSQLRTGSSPDRSLFDRFEPPRLAHVQCQKSSKQWRAAGKYLVFSLSQLFPQPPNATGLIQVCFSQIFGFLFQNCWVYCLLGRCLALPYPAPPGTAQGLTCLALCLMFFCLPDLYIKYITAFFNFLQLCVPQKNKKCLFLSLRFVSSRLRLFRPFGCACFPFLLYSKFRFAFFSPKGLRVFIVFRTTDWLQYEKTKKPEHKFRWPLCVCVHRI